LLGYCSVTGHVVHIKDETDLLIERSPDTMLSEREKLSIGSSLPAYLRESCYELVKTNESCSFYVKLGKHPL